MMNRPAVQAIGIWSALATVFFVAAGAVYGAWWLNYLMINLVLALIPLALTPVVMRAWQRKGWRSAKSWISGLLWLGFLPNSFYVITDVMHLVDTDTGVPLLFGAVMFWSFGFVGMAIGSVCVAAMHDLLLRRLSQAVAAAAVGGLLFLVSVGMYLGRIERWNTWDVLLHPLRIVMDVVYGLGWADWLLVMTYFLVVAGVYAGFWPILRLFKK